MHGHQDFVLSQKVCSIFHEVIHIVGPIPEYLRSTGRSHSGQSSISHFGTTQPIPAYLSFTKGQKHP